MVTSQTKYEESLDEQEMIDMMAEDDGTTDSSSCEDLEIQENSDSVPLLLRDYSICTDNQPAFQVHWKR